MGCFEQFLREEVLQGRRRFLLEREKFRMEYEVWPVIGDSKSLVVTMLGSKRRAQLDVENRWVCCTVSLSTIFLRWNREASGTVFVGLEKAK